MKCDTDDVRVKEVEEFADVRMKEQEKDWFDGCRRREEENEEKNERCDEDDGRKEQEEELTVGWSRKEEEEEFGNGRVKLEKEEKCDECGRWERDEWRKECVELDGCWTQGHGEEWGEEEEESGDDDDDEGRKE